jgi:hypothetical protein
MLESMHSPLWPIAAAVLTKRAGLDPSKRIALTAAAVAVPGPLGFASAVVAAQQAEAKPKDVAAKAKAAVAPSKLDALIAEVKTLHQRLDAMDAKLAAAAPSATTQSGESPQSGLGRSPKTAL